MSSRVAATYDPATYDDSGTMHAPVLDFDFPVAVIPSSTPGHSHVYLERAIPWCKYEPLLYALEEAGLIETGYYHASVARCASFVRKPDVNKPGTTVCMKRVLNDDELRAETRIGF